MEGALASLLCTRVTGDFSLAWPNKAAGWSPFRSGNLVDEGQRGGTHKEPGFRLQIPTVLIKRASTRPGAVSISSGDQVDKQGGLGQIHSSASWQLSSSCPSWLGLRHAERYTAVSWSSRWIIW